MLHVGLTGGLASGKSVVGRELERLGCHLIRLDELGHLVLAPDGEAYPAVVETFGPEILKADGSPHPEIDRSVLARLVFADPAQLDKLNALVHPPIRERAKALAAKLAQQHPEAILVTEAAIMIETGSYRDYDRVILTVCGEEQQVERAVARGKVTREEALERIRRQKPAEEKKRFANYVIDTSGSEEHTLQQTRSLFEKLRSLK